MAREKEEAEAEERRQGEEKERRRIQDVLNKQTFAQFKVISRDGPDIRLIFPVRYLSKLKFSMLKKNFAT